MKKNQRRIAAAVSALALAAGIVAVGSGTANAETKTGTIAEGRSAKVTRSIESTSLTSTGQIPYGSTITVTYRIDRHLAWLIYWIKDTHPECMKVVPNRSKWDAAGSKAANYTLADHTRIDNEFTSGPGWAMLDAYAANSWQATPMTWSQDYTVECDSGSLATGGVEWDSTLVGGAEVHPNIGPTILITKADTSTTVSVPSGVKASVQTTLTAAVNKIDATGQVEFYNGATYLGAGQLTDGDASIKWTPSAAGNYGIVAKYTGDRKFKESTSVASSGSIGTAPVNETVPSAPTFTLSADSVTLGGDITANISTVPNANLQVKFGTNTGNATADFNGNATYKIAPTAVGSTTVEVTASNSAGTSAKATKTITVLAAEAGTAVVSVNPAAPIAGDTVTLTVTGPDSGSTVTIANGATAVCTATANASKVATCTWTPAAGRHTLTIDSTVDGKASAISKAVTVSTAPIVDPGNGGGDGGGGDDGSGGDDGGGDSLGSLSSVFGSLG